MFFSPPQQPSAPSAIVRPAEPPPPTTSKAERREKIVRGLRRLCAAEPGRKYSQDQIAASVGCARLVIQRAEQSGLAKLRAALTQISPAEIEAYFNGIPIEELVARPGFSFARPRTPALSSAGQ